MLDEPLLDHRFDELGAIEVARQRRDPHASSGCDVGQRDLAATLGEHTASSLYQAGATCYRVTPHRPRRLALSIHWHQIIIWINSFHLLKGSVSVFA